MAQSKKMSFLESCVNVLIGYSVAILSQIIVFPIFGIEVSTRTHMLIGLYFTVISLVRSYIVRRIFNKIKG